ncbi:hypothetical protein SDC9_40254 [bioreactor metagenome]|uniref:Uncharacterized protein n=1 Tax=bioreactor metagenome TaxID=1076179 RepID=A0A644VRZ9_9ZZZZ
MHLGISYKRTDAIYRLGCDTVFFAEPESPEIDQRGTGYIEHPIGLLRDFHRLVENNTKERIHFHRFIPVYLRYDGGGVEGIDGVIIPLQCLLYLFIQCLGIAVFDVVRGMQTAGCFEILRFFLAAEKHHGTEQHKCR